MAAPKPRYQRLFESAAEKTVKLNDLRKKVEDQKETKELASCTFRPATIAAISNSRSQEPVKRTAAQFYLD
jgi:hypothetical protein